MKKSALRKIRDAYASGRNEVTLNVSEMFELLNAYDDDRNRNPKPLTLEELKAKNEEPVYVMWRPDENWKWGKSGWGIAGFWTSGVGIDEASWQYTDYGETWLAYDHEPKEATHDNP